MTVESEQRNEIVRTVGDNDVYIHVHGRISSLE